MPRKIFYGPTDPYKITAKEKTILWSKWLFRNRINPKINIKNQVYYIKFSYEIPNRLEQVKKIHSLTN